MVTLDDVKSALDKSEEEVMQFVRERRLHAFQQGTRLMFDADDVGRLRNELDGIAGASHATESQSIDRSAQNPTAGGASEGGSNGFLSSSGLIDIANVDDSELAASLDDLIPTGRPGHQNGTTRTEGKGKSEEARGGASQVHDPPDDQSQAASWLRAIGGRLHPRLGTVKADLVRCTVFAPPIAFLGESLLVQAFAHLPEETKQVKATARQVDETTEPRVSAALETHIRRGARLDFRLVLPGLGADGATVGMVWRGSAAAVQFTARIPGDFARDTLTGSITISQDSVPMGHIKFS